MTENYQKNQLQSNEYKSMRLPNYDYRTAGAYAITICAQERWRSLFDVPTLQAILKETWNDLTQYITHITPDLMVIMPDHLHCIIWQQTGTKNKKSISDIMGYYKSLSANAWIRHLKASGEEYPGKIWQKSFYDHIIRNERDLCAQRAYMLNNPQAAELKKKQIEKKDACEYVSCGHIPFPPK